MSDTENDKFNFDVFLILFSLYHSIQTIVKTYKRKNIKMTIELYIKNKSRTSCVDGIGA